MLGAEGAESRAISRRSCDPKPARPALAKHSPVKLPTDVAKLAFARRGRRRSRRSPRRRARQGRRHHRHGAQTRTPEQVQALVAEVNELGDAARGEADLSPKDLAARSATPSAERAGRSGPTWSASAHAPSPTISSSRCSTRTRRSKRSYHSVVVALDDGARSRASRSARPTKT